LFVTQAVRLNTVLQSSNATGRPIRHAERVVGYQAARRAPEHGFTKFQFNGGRGATAIHSRSVTRFVRKGLKGRGAVAAKSKKPCMGFLILP
jgi:hypothetical protein